MMSSVALIERPVTDFAINNLPYDLQHENVHLQDPSKIRLSLTHLKYPLDIGCLAYSVRKRKGSNTRNADCVLMLVNTASLRRERLPAVQNLLDSIYTAFRTGQHRERTIHTILQHCQLLIDWCDQHGYANVLETFPTAQRALKAYIAFLVVEVKSSRLNINTAAMRQNNALRVLSWMLMVDANELIAGTRKISSNLAARDTTELPDELSVKTVITLCQHLFDNLADFVVDHQSYPFQLKLPGESVWVFPARRWMATKIQLEQRESWGYGCWAWNYETGAINEVKDIYKKYRCKDESSQRGSAKRSIRSAKQLLSRANDDARHVARLILATWAHDAFLMMFFANTGMNFSQTQNLVWCSDFDAGKERQGFRAIKYRAKGKAVQFNITTKFLPRFRRYLRLRDYLLGDNDFPYLFLSLGLGSVGAPKQIPDKILTEFFKKSRESINPGIPSITSRQFRTYKSDYLIKNTDVATTAMMLQNSVETTLKHYTVGSQSEANAELSNYYAKMHHHIFVDEQPASHRPVTVGHCRDTGFPEADSPAPSFEPDCKKPEGCLFCQKYAVHADEKDIRKLISLKYVINETEPLAKTPDHHFQIFGEVLHRIELILDEVSKKSATLASLVYNVKKDVENTENLDPYWEGKLAMLYEIGLL